MNNKYKQGQDRIQPLLFPPSIDDYVDEDNAVRVIESYVDILNLKELGFEDTRKSNRTDGQKAYHPSLLLKIYIYGYLNKIRSSRALEKEIKRNIELIWLTSGLTPSYHTIADFRKNNSKALKQVFKEFVLLCKNIDLIGDGIKAVDGAFLRANASKNQLIMKRTLDRDLIKIKDDISKYLTTLEFADKEQQVSNIANKLPKDLRKLKYKKEELSSNLKLLEALGKTQYNSTDPDATLMRKPAHNLMAYNSQIVVDSTFKFIVATNISTQGNDLNQIHKMAQETKENLQIDKNDNLDIVGDTGYYSSKEFKKCEEDNINAIVPEANSTKAQQDKNKFTRDKFIYDEKQDCCICPNNKILHKALTPQLKGGKVNYIYRTPSPVCNSCNLRDKCISVKTKYKQIFRWEHEEIVDRHKAKMKTQEAIDIVKKRGSIVEHPFGTIKRTLGWDHFLVRGKDKVSGENALIMFTYNFKRLLNLIGITLFKKLIIAIQKDDYEQIRKDIEEYILYFKHYIAYILQNLLMIRVYQQKLAIRNAKVEIT